MQMKNDCKARLRKELLAQRRNLDEMVKANHNACIINHLFSWTDYKNAGVVMIYLSMPDEPSTDAIITDALAKGKTVCVPRMLSTYGFMEAVKLRNLNHLVKSRLSIREPNPNETLVIEPARIDLVIVPGVVFDPAGNRIGMGAGYYDRFLTRAPRAIRLGLAWQFQVKPEVSAASHDIKMHYLLTERGLLQCSEGKM